MYHHPKMGRCWDVPGGPVVKILPCNAGGMGSIPGWRTEVLYATASMSAQSLQPCPFLCNPMNCSPLPMGFPSKNTGVGYRFLLEGIFPTQGLNPRLLWLLHHRQTLYGATREAHMPWSEAKNYKIREVRGRLLMTEFHSKGLIKH